MLHIVLLRLRNGGSLALPSLPSLALPLRCHLILHLLEQLVEVAQLLALRLARIALIASFLESTLPFIQNTSSLPLRPRCS